MKVVCHPAPVGRYRSHRRELSRPELLVTILGTNVPVAPNGLASQELILPEETISPIIGAVE